MSFQRGSRDPKAALTMIASLSWNSCVGRGIYCNLDADFICKKVTMPSCLTYHSFARWPDPVHPLSVAGPVRSRKRMRSSKRRKREGANSHAVTLHLHISDAITTVQSVTASKQAVKMLPGPHLRITKTGTVLQSHNVSCLLHMQWLCFLNALR
jgi:hypothetical protein